MVSKDKPPIELVSALAIASMHQAATTPRELPPMRFSLAPRAGIIPHSLGKFVSYDDYAALATRLAEYEARAEGDAAEIANLRQLCRDMLPVFQAARPLVLNLERLKDAAIAQEAGREAE